MSKIIVLDELTACQIAAGEVIERPASVVKELAENSIDAGATFITVEIRAGGVKYIRITDNGCGFEADDAVIAFDKHATSKIQCGEDLDKISTLGFRGEALASIAAVADVELLSKTEEAQIGVYVHIKGCEVIETSEKGAAKGSVITVKDLFYNTPARYKFLKKDSTEASHIIDVLQKLAIANPKVSFRLISNGNEVFRTPGNGDLKSVIFSIFGKETVSNILPVKYESDGYKLCGFAGVREAVYSTRSRQIFFVNGRCIRSKSISSALDEAYKTVTMKNKYPFAVLLLDVPVSKVDVNVHPTKAEVRFSDESSIYRVIYHGVSNALFYENSGKISDKQRTDVQMPVKTAGPAQSSSVVPVRSNHVTPIIPVIPEIPIQKETHSSAKPGKLPEIWTSESEVKDEIVQDETVDILQKAVADIKHEPVVNHAQTTIPEKEHTQKTAYYTAPENTITNMLYQENLSQDQSIQDQSIQDQSIQEELIQEQSIQEQSIPDQLIQEQQVQEQPIQEQPAPEVSLQSTLSQEIPVQEELVLYNSTSVYTDSVIVGQVFDTYIVLQYGDDVVLIDQHAAHERIKYEEIKAAVNSSSGAVSPMLVPITLQLTPAEYTVLSGNMDFFEAMGFEIDDFGENTVLVRAVPTILADSNIEDVILSGLQNKKTNGYTDEEIYTMACKAAVKANKKLSHFEIEELLAQLAKLENSGTCPHGRPISVTLTKHELERRFKRCL